MNRQGAKNAKAGNGLSDLRIKPRNPFGDEGRRLAVNASFSCSPVALLASWRFVSDSRLLPLHTCQQAYFQSGEIESRGGELLGSFAVIDEAIGDAEDAQATRVDAAA
jgi:hypothetical protein